MIGVPDNAAAIGGFAAGAAKTVLSGIGPGVRLVGYGNRVGVADRVHTPLHVRAVVLGTQERRLAVCSVELCYIGEDIVAAARRLIAEQTGIPADHIFIAATHTHSGPSDADPHAFPQGLHTEVAATVTAANSRLRPARIGAGWGSVRDCSINRRRLEDPTDPALAVVRIDETDGRPIATVYSFGCHPVILGPDSAIVHGDWPGSCSGALEADTGHIALFLQAAGADVNPVTDAVLSRLADGRAVMGTTAHAAYYGPFDDAFELVIGNRTGGTVDQVDQLAATVAAEVRRVRTGISTTVAGDVWARQLHVTTGSTRGGAPPAGLDAPRADPSSPLEVMLAGLSPLGLVLAGQPGEIFVSTGVALRTLLRGAGFEFPLVISHANGRRGYLPPAAAYADGGYEIDWAKAMGLPAQVQDRITERLLAAANAQRAAQAFPELRLTAPPPSEHRT